MDLTTPPKSFDPGYKGYIVLPPEPEPEPTSWHSPGFIIFAVLVIGAAAVAGSVQSGKLDLNKYFNAPKPAVVTSTAPRPAPVVTIPAPKAGTFVVTAISLGQPSFAIVNGKSRIEGDPVEAPGVTGWKVKQIVDGAVYLQNGATVTSIPLSLPGIKPLDDKLQPLN